MQGDFERISALTNKAESECSSFDFDYLRAELLGFSSGDFTLLKDKLRSSLQESRENGWPCGYQAVRLNIILAQETHDEKEALRLLDDIQLTDQDFPWLEDMCRLAKCQLAAKTGKNLTLLR